MRLWSSALVCLAFGCASKAPPPDTAPKSVSAEDEILGVAKLWRTMEKTRGARPASNQVSTFEIEFDTSVTLLPGKGAAKETIEVRERFQMRDGRTYECTAEHSGQMKARYGRRDGEPAVELSRPPVRLVRKCQPADFYEPEIQLGAEGSRFLLRDEQLVGFQPPGEKRVFLPAD
jgi:hypothetical protein